MLHMCSIQSRRLIDGKTLLPNKTNNCIISRSISFRNTNITSRNHWKNINFFFFATQGDILPDTIKADYSVTNLIITCNTVKNNDLNVVITSSKDVFVFSQFFDKVAQVYAKFCFVRADVVTVNF